MTIVFHVGVEGAQARRFFQRRAEVWGEPGLRVEEHLCRRFTPCDVHDFREAQDLLRANDCALALQGLV